MISELDKVGLVYDKLTEKEKKFFKDYIWNGVGSRSFFVNPHDLIFKEASLYHDFYYWRGGPQELRELADKDFFHRCHSAVRKQPKYKRPFYYLTSYVYFAFLRMLGKVAWEYSEKPSKTFKELLDKVHFYYDNNPNISGRPPKFK